MDGTIEALCDPFVHEYSENVPRGPVCGLPLFNPEVSIQMYADDLMIY